MNQRRGRQRSLGESSAMGMRRCTDARDDRTSTLMRVQHELAFRIFFSIEGETIGGEPIPGGNQTGEMRMLVLTVPCFLASCCCIAERVKLPECKLGPWIALLTH